MTPIPFTAPLARALLRSQSDERLVGLAKEGHEGAFDEIVRRYRQPLVAFAAAYAPSDRAEDVVQEGLASAWAALEGSDREIALKPWLYTIIRNRALNAKRDTRYHAELDETIDGVRRPDEIVLQRDQLSRAVAAVAALPEPQRKALVDSAVEGRTHDQIAAELGTSAGSVRGLIHRGRVAARGAMGALVPAPILAWAASGGAVSGGVAAGSVAAGSAAGGSLAAQGATVAAIAVLAAGSGIVIERSLSDSAKNEREAGAAERSQNARGQDSEQGSEAGADGNRGGDAVARNGDNSGPGGRDDSSGPGGGDEDNSGPGGGDDDSSGPGSDDDDSGHDNDGGDDDNSGPGGGDDGSGDDSSGFGSGDDSSGGDDDNSGSGSSNSGSGSDSSGSGSGSDDDSSGSGSDDEFEDAEDDD